MVDNHLGKARELSLRTGEQTMLYLSHRKRVQTCANNVFNVLLTQELWALNYNAQIQVCQIRNSLAPRLLPCLTSVSTA